MASYEGRISIDRRDVPVTTPAAISEVQIRMLVDRFYERIRADADLGPIFEIAIAGDWGPHLAKMYDFWSSVMLMTGRYKGNPVAVHRRIDGLEIHLFDRWLSLFGQTCDDMFDSETAGLFRLKAARIAESLKLALFYRPDQSWPGSVP